MKPSSFSFIARNAWTQSTVQDVYAEDPFWHYLLDTIYLFSPRLTWFGHFFLLLPGIPLRNYLTKEKGFVLLLSLTKLVFCFVYFLNFDQNQFNLISLWICLHFRANTTRIKKCYLRWNRVSNNFGIFMKKMITNYLKY